ncbi:MAG TPA: hypothetical protein VE262_00340 [Blastocatellia bacterium]|nr:hypothetical protein [Blastocatellia bacterium]
MLVDVAAMLSGGLRDQVMALGQTLITAEAIILAGVLISPAIASGRKA